MRFPFVLKLEKEKKKLKLDSIHRVHSSFASKSPEFAMLACVGPHIGMRSNVLLQHRRFLASNATFRAHIAPSSATPNIRIVFVALIPSWYDRRRKCRRNGIAAVAIVPTFVGRFGLQILSIFRNARGDRCDRLLNLWLISRWLHIDFQRHRQLRRGCLIVVVERRADERLRMQRREFHVRIGDSVLPVATVLLLALP